MIPLGFLAASAAAANWTLKAHVAATTDGTIDTTVTTTGVDTTGANLIVLSLSCLAGASLTVSDSKGNTWTALTTRNDSIGQETLYYCLAPIVGASHTFTATSGSQTFPSLYAAAFSSGTPSPSLDQQNGGTTTSTSTVASGSITPTVSKSLIVSGLEFFNGGLPSVNSGLTITDRIDSVGGQWFGGAMAYLIQSTAAPVNATWSNAGFQNAAAAIASFKP